MSFSMTATTPVTDPQTSSSDDETSYIGPAAPIVNPVGACVAVAESGRGSSAVNQGSLVGNTTVQSVSSLPTSEPQPLLPDTNGNGATDFILHLVGTRFLAVGGFLP